MIRLLLICVSFSIFKSCDWFNGTTLEEEKFKTSLESTSDSKSLFDSESDNLLKENSKKIAKTTEDLTKITKVFNFMNWYRGENYTQPDNDDPVGRGIGSFYILSGQNEAMKNHIFESPYFWIAFWNGYEVNKNSKTSPLNEEAIKRIFEKGKGVKPTESSQETTDSRREKKGLKNFVDAILNYATSAGAAPSMTSDGKIALSNAIADLTNGNSAVNAVSNLESLILWSLWHSVTKKLESCNIVATSTGLNEFANADTSIPSYDKHYLKGGVLQENGVLIPNIDITKLSNLKEEAIRGITILQKSIELKMLPKLVEGTANVAAATKFKNIQTARLASVISKLKTELKTSIEFVSGVCINDLMGTCVVVTTQEKALRGGDQREILDGGTTSPLRKMDDFIKTVMSISKK